MDISSIRLKNLMLLLADWQGTQQSFCDFSGIDKTYLSQLKSKSTRSKKKRMGDDVARRLEQKHGKPSGWMDVLHPVDGRFEMLLELLANLPERYREAMIQQALIYKELADKEEQAEAVLRSQGQTEDDDRNDQNG